MRSALWCIAVYRRSGFQMSISTISLQGEYPFKLDPKSRVSVPADWCPNPDQVLRLMRSENEGVKCLKVLTENELAKILTEIDQQEDWTPAMKRKMAGAVHGRCFKTTTNKQSKLLIPQDLMAWADLEAGGSVTLVGRGDFYEIFASEAYGALSAQEDAELAEMNRRLGIF